MAYTTRAGMNERKTLYWSGGQPDTGPKPRKQAKNGDEMVDRGMHRWLVHDTLGAAVVQPRFCPTAASRFPEKKTHPCTPSNTISTSYTKHPHPIARDGTGRGSGGEGVCREKGLP